MVTCTKCQAGLKPALVNTGDFERCPACGARSRVEVFPALLSRPEAGIQSEALLVDSEASCFFHPQKKAAVVCAVCGRFICGLCDMEINGEHMCPNCLDAGQKKRNIKDLENSRILYDSVALYCALLSCLFSVVSGFLAPITLFVVIRYWKAPGSITGRTKIRFIVAAVIAVLQITGTGFFLYAAMT